MVRMYKGRLEEPGLKSLTLNISLATAAPCVHIYCVQVWTDWCAVLRFPTAERESYPTTKTQRTVPIDAKHTVCHQVEAFTHFAGS